MATRILLKRGTCGDVHLEPAAKPPRIVRDLAAARVGCRWLARRLARREARALERLEGIDGVPTLIALESTRLVRTALPGQPMHAARPASREYFRHALHLVRRLHRRGVTHNDLAKEANWICRDSTRPGIVDFELASCFERRSRRFRLLAREDLRHLLKHKACYRPDLLTRRQRALLARPAWPARLWRWLVKPVYRLVTRRLLGWPERTGPAERERAA
jgi:predicted Ser/Thr protein kinase